VSQRFYTVGFSNGSLEHVVALLLKHHVRTVVDVRTNPGSGKFQQFNREQLESLLPKDGLSYRHRGRILGGHPEEPELYRPDGRVDFEMLETQPKFQRALDALLEEELEAPVIACTEDDPFKCPRFFLLGRLLATRGIEVLHIDYATGFAEPHQIAERRMVEQMIGSGQSSLFASPTDDVMAAYQRLAWQYEHRAPWKRKKRG
jgi:uncharacterized protein (DUF488 family)